MKSRNVRTILILILSLSLILTACSVGTNALNPPSEGTPGNEEEVFAPGEPSEPEEPKFVEEVIPEVTFPENTLFITGRKVNVREDIAKDAKVLGNLSKGDQVIFLEEKQDENGEETWVKVSYIDEKGNDVSGWINGKYASRNWLDLIGEK